ncbi:hypothetical protein [Phyllobacterium sp. SB3]
MTKKITLTVVIVAIVGLVVAAVVAINWRNNGTWQQPSPHALDQTN